MWASSSWGLACSIHQPNGVSRCNRIMRVYLSAVHRSRLRVDLLHLPSMTPDAYYIQRLVFILQGLLPRVYKLELEVPSEFSISQGRTARDSSPRSPHNRSPQLAPLSGTIGVELECPFGTAVSTPPSWAVDGADKLYEPCGPVKAGLQDSSVHGGSLI